MTHFALIALLQSQEPPKISKVVWGAAILVFLAGLSLVIYLMRRLKKGEKEPEEDWSLSRRSIFAEESASQESEDGEVPARVVTEPLASESVVAGVEPVSESAPLESIPIPPPDTGTELLTSARPGEAADESTPLEEEIWAELEPISPPEVSAQTEPLASSPDQADQPSARVDQPPHRQPFAPPEIHQIVRRAPFEPPRIEPLTPVGRPSGDRRPVSEVDSTKSEPVRAVPSSSTARSYKPAGSVLGLPAEVSHAPLVVGEPSRPSSDAGISALASYGKEADRDGGHGGLITLLITLVLVAGAVLSYLYVPSVHSRVDSFVERIRGRQPEVSAQAPSTPRVQVYPSRSEATKNQVKAWGVVYNISSEPIEGLSIEVTLERADGSTPDLRTIPVTPTPLAPRQQGRYEFQYDGSATTGFSRGYRITRLLDKDGEVPFTQPK